MSPAKKLIRELAAYCLGVKPVTYWATADFAACGSITAWLRSLDINSLVSEDVLAQTHTSFEKLNSFNLVDVTLLMPTIPLTDMVTCFGIRKALA